MATEKDEREWSVQEINNGDYPIFQHIMDDAALKKHFIDYITSSDYLGCNYLLNKTKFNNLKYMAMLLEDHKIKRIKNMSCLEANLVLLKGLDLD